MQKKLKRFNCIYCTQQTNRRLQTLRNAAADASKSSVLSGADASHRKGPSDMILYQMMHLFFLFSIYFLPGPPRETQTLRKHKTQHCFLTKRIVCLCRDETNVLPFLRPCLSSAARNVLFFRGRVIGKTDVSVSLILACHVRTGHRNDSACRRFLHSAV